MGNEDENTEVHVIDADEVIAFINEIGIDKFNEFKDSFKKEEKTEKKEEPNSAFNELQLKQLTELISKAMGEMSKPEPEKKKIVQKKEPIKRQDPMITEKKLIGNDNIGYI